MERGKAIPHITFRRFTEGTILYIEGTDESLPIENWKLAHWIMEAVNSYNPERDRIARELAKFLLSLHPQIPNNSTYWNCPTCFRARQLLKLYKEKP